MSTFDKVMHVVGIVAGVIVTVGVSGGVAMPAWLIVAAGAIAPIASGVAASPLVKKPPPQ